jgi:hypothetical protein
LDSLRRNISIAEEFLAAGDYISNGKATGSFYRTFPYCENTPAFGLQLGQGNIIARPVPRNLVLPEFFPRCRPFEQMTTMPMPEAAVNEYDRAVLGKDEIRAARQFASLQAEAETEGMQSAADDQFRSRIAPPDTAHVEATLLR